MQIFICLNEARQTLRDDMNELTKKGGKQDAQMATFSAIKNFLQARLVPRFLGALVRELVRACVRV